ncbi:molecular chaperone HscC [Massilia sp. CCM 8734]|uniref:Hsp70 family protein n=1 Tax=Massilia sp. CCM 8734 TaxID=2609283 RepID=UPI001423ED9C|nr:molecular chaperone HscC [Massilia sp. CCM 8734]NHZ99266.1 Hsp70 family protein [Massilia sp. CCM 8734]
MIIGIDLGTTNSLAAVWRDGKAELIPNALGHVLTPSCVSLADDGAILVGLPARDRLLTNPSLSAAAFKRTMGTDRRIRLGTREFRPEELSALVLKSLVADAEAFLGEPVHEAVITVPAYFNDIQRKATRIAGELAGLKVERLLNEPTAAALAYGLHNAPLESQYLVFDLGGGTFDVSILELFAGVMEVRATAGDNFLGGEDFTDALVKGFIEHVGRDAGLRSEELTPAQHAGLRIEAERVKRALSGHDLATFRFQPHERELRWDVSTADYETLCAPLLARLAAPLERTLRDAGLMPSDLDRIVMVGGATRMSIVYRMLARLFGRFPSRDINPDEAIVMGAAVQAGLKARDAALKDVVMTDVCPYTLGIETCQQYDTNRYRDGVFSPIIERNTTIPASRCETYGPTSREQTSVRIKVFQGESRDTSDNIELGSLSVPLPAQSSADKEVDVRFTYDINGLLEVEATVRATGLVRTLLIEQSPGAMSPDDIALSLAAIARLKVPPREWAEVQALQERMKRLYEQSLGQRRAWIGERVDQFDTIVARQNPREIARAVQILGEALLQFDTSALL